MVNYITLDSYKYKVRVKNYIPGFDADRRVERGVTGKTLVSYGGTVDRWFYTIRVHSTAESGWGTIATLEATLKKISPPSNQLTMIDHNSTSHTVIITSPKIQPSSLRPTDDIRFYQIEMEEYI